MLFNSFSFLFGFLPCVLLGWWLLPTKTLRLAFLTGASWFFYAWWDWRYLPVLIGATSVDYVAGLWISRSEEEARRRFLLAASLTTNVGILAYSSTPASSSTPSTASAAVWAFRRIWPRCTSCCRSGSPSTRSTRCR